MKQKQFLKILLLLNFIFIFLTKAFSQNYIPFPDSSTNWNVSWNDADCNINNLPDGAYSYYINGDTIINGTTYHKILILQSASFHETFQLVDESGNGI